MLKQPFNWRTTLDNWVKQHHITELDKQFAEYYFLSHKICVSKILAAKFFGDFKAVGKLA